MTEERFDIEITDKISPGISAKLKAIARDALAADTAVQKLKADLIAINGGAIDRVSAAFRRAKAATQEDMIAKARAAQAAKTAQYEFNKLLGVNQRLEKSARASAAAFKDLLGAQERSARAAALTTSGPILQGRPVNQSTAPTRQAQYRAQNLFYQIQDIGVSLGSGQRASTVLLQQGSQILGIYGASGGLRAGLAQLRTDFLKLIPPQALAALAALSVGFLYLRNEIRQTTGVKVTLGETIIASLKVAYGYIKDTFMPLFKTLAPGVSFIFQPILVGMRKVVNGLIGLADIAVTSFVAIFKRLPGLLGNIFVFAYNNIVRLTEVMLNKVLGAIALIEGPINRLNKLVGGKENIDLGLKVDFSNVIVPLKEFNEAEAEISAAVSRASNKNYLGQFAKDVAKQAVADHLKNTAENAKKATKELSDYEKLVQELNAPLLELAKTAPLLDLAFKRGDITLEMKTRKMRELRMAVLELSSDLDSGLKLGLLRVEEQFTNVADVASKLVVNAFQSAEDALVSFVTKGKLDIKSLVDSIAADFARLAIRQSITGPLAGMLGQLGSSSSSVGGSILSGLSDILPSFDVGTSYVPRDMIAQIHKGERIVPASQNTASRTSSGNASFNVTNSININWTSSGGAANDNDTQAERLAQEMQRQLDQSMQRYIDKQKRIGGQLNAGNVVA